MPADMTHPVFRQPADPEAKVWRYMDFTKYLALLESSALYFTRIDLLGDPFEGSWSAKSDKALERLFLPGHLTNEQIERFRSLYEQNRRLFRKSTFVSCWYMADYESAAMWRLYAKTDEAIAIATTYRRLADALPADVLIGMVNYIDYDKVMFPIDNILWPAIHKRLSFEHEREVRAVKVAVDESTDHKGHSVQVQLQALVERIYVSPNSPDWYHNLVASLTERLGFKFPVTNSRLSERPIL